MFMKPLKEDQNPVQFNSDSYLQKTTVNQQ